MMVGTGQGFYIRHNVTQQVRYKCEWRRIWWYRSRDYLQAWWD